MKAVVVLVVLLCANAAVAAETVPVSYVTPPGEVGWYPYYDDTGSQLTDGLHGLPWPSEPGWVGDDPYPWVAWDGHSVSLTFFLAGVHILDSVDLYTGRAVRPSIYIPRTVDVYGRVGTEPWSLIAHAEYDDTAFADERRHTLGIALSGARADAVRIDLAPTARWIFLDEVDFSGSPVPEPASLLALLCGIGALPLFRRRRS